MPVVIEGADGTVRTKVCFIKLLFYTVQVVRVKLSNVLLLFLIMLACIMCLLGI